jgi:hypothetical protein
MSTSDFGIGRQQGCEFALTQQSGELPAMFGSPGGSPMFEEDTGVSLEGKPSVRRGHCPVPADSNAFGNEGQLVGLVSNMLDHSVRDNEIERIFDKRQMPAIGDDEVVPRDRMLSAPVEALEENSAGNEHLSNVSHSVGDDVLERLVLTGLDADHQDAPRTDRSDYLFKPLRLPIPVEDAEAASRSRDEVAHDGSLWQAMVAKPIVAVALALVCFFAAACSTVSSQEANRQVPPAADAQPDDSAQASVGVGSLGAETTAELTGLEEESTVGSEAELRATSAGERGSRNLGAESAAQEATAETGTPETATSETEPTPEAALTSEPAVTPEPVEDPEPTTIATTEPLATATPLTAAVPTPTTGPDPDRVFTGPTPTGPVPSDDIVIHGPEIDESETASISENGALACALTESAIEFLDLGDGNRMAAALQEAAQYAGQAVEPEITLMAADLTAAGSNEEAAIAAIIATLGACAIHGYQV